MVTVSVEEKPEVSNYVVVRSGEVKIRTENDGYVGYDIYDESGRLLYRESLGYLPRGGYTLNLPSLPHGTYVLKIRAAKALRSIKLIF
jgi:triacylglycerol esterase/lipase EstA (alpha/beta hydrolase family)